VDHARHREHREQHAERRVERQQRHARRRERGHAETRDEILVSAREVLLERGAADLSLREIARRAGFSPAALYKYFESKDDVVRTLADTAMSRLAEAFAALPAGLSPDRRAVELGMVYLDFAREYREDVAVIEMDEAAGHVHPLAPDHVAVEEAVIGVFRDGFEAGVFAGSAEDAPVVAYGAWALVQGLARFERLQRPALADKLRPRQRELLAIYVEGLKTAWTGSGGPAGEQVEGT
jgi:AcrR family transcriptional regulator